MWKLQAFDQAQREVYRNEVDVSLPVVEYAPQSLRAMRTS